MPSSPWSLFMYLTSKVKRQHWEVWGALQKCVCVFSSVSCIILLCFAKQADFLTKFQKLWPYEKAWVMTNDCLFQPTLGHHMMLCIVHLKHKQVLVQFPQITVCHAAVLWLWSWIISIFQRLTVSTAFPALSRKWKKLALRQLQRFHEFIQSVFNSKNSICQYVHKIARRDYRNTA